MPLHPCLAVAAFLLISQLVASPASAQVQTWRLASKPALTIGDSLEAGGVSFGRVIGALVLPNGDIVVADEATNSLRFFGADGRQRAAAGRTGSGPGEFRTIRSLHRCSRNEVVAYDPSALRLSVFTLSGTFSRSLTVQALSEGGAPPYDVACNLKEQFVFVNRSAEPPAGIGPRRPRVAVTLVSEKEPKRVVGDFPASERYFNGQNDYPRPLGRVTSVAATLTHVYVSTGDSGTISTYALSSAQKSFVTLPADVKKVTGKNVDDFVVAELDKRGTGDRTARERMLRAGKFPDVFPTTRRMLVDTENRVWVESFPVPNTPSVTWTVVDGSQRVIATLAVPNTFEVTDFSSREVVGITFSADGIPLVQRFGIVRP